MPLPTPRELVLDLLTAVAPKPLPAAALVEGARVFGHSENVLRVTLSRLRGEERVASPRRGIYVLGPTAAPLVDRIRAWRHRPGAEVWDGDGWLAALTRERPARAPTLLRALGFALLTPTLAVRPDDGRRDLAELAPLAPTWMALRLSSLDDEARLLASSLWNLSALLEGHRAMRAALAASRRRHARRVRATDEALRETFVLGGEAIRALVLDPHLPAALCPPGPRERLRDAMVRYDALGRRLWEARLGIAFDRRAPARLDAMEISA